MPKNLEDFFDGGKWTGPVVRLTPTDKTGTPESFEKLYERRAPARRVVEAPRPKLKAIENPSLQDRMQDLGLNEEA